jgi:hypothetical protein
MARRIKGQVMILTVIAIASIFLPVLLLKPSDHSLPDPDFLYFKNNLKRELENIPAISDVDDTASNVLDFIDFVSNSTRPRLVDIQLNYSHTLLENTAEVSSIINTTCDVQSINQSIDGNFSLRLYRNSTLIHQYTEQISLEDGYSYNYWDINQPGNNYRMLSSIIYGDGGILNELSFQSDSGIYTNSTLTYTFTFSIRTDEIYLLDIVNGTKYSS